MSYLCVCVCVSELYISSDCFARFSFFHSTLCTYGKEKRKKKKSKIELCIHRWNRYICSTLSDWQLLIVSPEVEPRQKRQRREIELASNYKIIEFSQLNICARETEHIALATPTHTHTHTHVQFPVTCESIAAEREREIRTIVSKNSSRNGICDRESKLK